MTEEPAPASQCGQDIAARALAPPVLVVPAPVRTAAGLVTWRPLRVEDEHELFALISRIEATDEAMSSTRASEVGAQLVAARASLDKNTLVAVDPTGTARAYGFVESPRGDVTIIRAFVRGGVDPDVRRRGIGSALLAWQIGRARQLLVEADKHAPARIVAFVENDQRDEARLLSENGFVPMRFYTRLWRDLTEPIPEAAVPASVRLVPWSPELSESVRLAHNEAFEDHWGSQPRSRESWERNLANLDVASSFIALDAEPRGAAATVAGYVLSSISTDTAGASSGFTDLLGVRRAYRGKRIASALLAAALRAYREAGLGRAELDVDSENPSRADVFYANLGYLPRGSETMFSIEV